MTQGSAFFMLELSFFISIVKKKEKEYIFSRTNPEMNTCDATEKKKKKKNCPVKNTSYLLLTNLA